MEAVEAVLNTPGMLIRSGQKNMPNIAVMPTGRE